MTSLPWPLVPSRPASPLRGGKRCFTEGECGGFEERLGRSWGEGVGVGKGRGGAGGLSVTVKQVLDNHRPLVFLVLLFCVFFAVPTSVHSVFVCSFFVVVLLWLQVFVTCSDGVLAA